ncbi:hypothetical protein [Halorarum halobium]|uniref:hypothetical protein n=1 Tax=Halorarum halobium TaxID=3075121 RepID=UPI0028ABD358|nr:hypothetical protein [Halobaculum sp. XH14]
MATRIAPDRRTVLFAAMGVLFAVAVAVTDEVSLTSAAFASALPWLALALAAVFLVIDADQVAATLFVVAAALGIAAGPVGVPALTTAGGAVLAAGFVVAGARRWNDRPSRPHRR